MGMAHSTTRPTAMPDDGPRLDFVAGLTAAAVVLPKAMAYATVAGLPVCRSPWVSTRRSRRWRSMR